MSHDIQRESERGGGGSALILVALLLVLISALATLYILSEELLSRFMIEGDGSLEVTKAYWEYNGSIVKAVEEGALVHAVVKLSSSVGYEGYVEVRVRRDLTLLPDLTVAVVKQYYVVKPGVEVEFRVTFKARCTPLSRGYHVDVVWRGGKYTMPESYPPRLKIMCGG